MATDPQVPPGKKAIPFAQFLDGLAPEFAAISAKMDANRLKPAMLLDVLVAMQSCMALQQVDVITYNMAVENYTSMMNKVVANEKRVADLEFKVAEQVAVIQTLKDELNSVKGNITSVIVNELANDGNLAQKFKDLLK